MESNEEHKQDQNDDKKKTEQLVQSEQFDQEPATEQDSVETTALKADEFPTTTTTTTTTQSNAEPQKDRNEGLSKVDVCVTNVPVSAPEINIESVKDSTPVACKTEEASGPEVLAQETKPISTKRKDDDKLALYKSLAIKLKKELVKTREELQKLRDEYQATVSDLRLKLNENQEMLKSERLSSSYTYATQEALIKSLTTQLESAENDLQSVQTEFEDYKIRATEIMQKNNPVQLSMQSNRGFEEERYKQLKQLNDDYKVRLADQKAQSDKLSRANCDLERECKLLKEELNHLQNQLGAQSTIGAKYEKLQIENDALRATLKQYTEKYHLNSRKNQIDVQSKESATHQVQGDIELSKDHNLPEHIGPKNPTFSDDQSQQATFDGEIEEQNDTTHVSPSASSVDSYVHIKPATLEIISRSSILEDAQKQIDDLTKAYLDSESTNSLLSEQVRALKEEIRRVQRGTERMSLADNLEYLKNIVFKFLTLDNSQTEQKQCLVPVLSTVLRLSPEETAKLNSIAILNRNTVTSSLFRLS